MWRLRDNQVRGLDNKAERLLPSSDHVRNTELNTKAFATNRLKLILYVCGFRWWLLSQGSKERLHSAGGLAHQGDQDVPSLPLHSHPHPVSLASSHFKRRQRQRQTHSPNRWNLKSLDQNSAEHGFPATGFQVENFYFKIHNFLTKKMFINHMCVILQKPKPSGDRATYEEEGIFGRSSPGTLFRYIRYLIRCPYLFTYIHKLTTERSEERKFFIKNTMFEN